MLSEYLNPEQPPGSTDTRSPPASVETFSAAMNLRTSAAAWSVIERAIDHPRACNDLNGVVHDLLWMSRTLRRQVDSSTVLFQCTITGTGRKSLYTFKMVCGPGDDAQPVVELAALQCFGRGERTDDAGAVVIGTSALARRISATA